SQFSPMLVLAPSATTCVSSAVSRCGNISLVRFRGHHGVIELVHQRMTFQVRVPHHHDPLLVRLQDNSVQRATMFLPSATELCDEERINPGQGECQIAIWRQIDELDQLATAQVTVDLLIGGRALIETVVIVHSPQRKPLPLPLLVVRTRILLSWSPVTADRT